MNKAWLTTFLDFLVLTALIFIKDGHSSISGWKLVKLRQKEVSGINFEYLSLWSQKVEYKLVGIWVRKQQSQTAKN